MTHFATWAYTKLFGEKVGDDQFGNSYYRKGKKRWVIYKGMAEASKVPPDWHGWLHYSTNEIPANSGKKIYQWEQPHEMNLTGTKHAYMPPGHGLKGGKRKKATGDYTSWQGS